jgi:hypothetical protein
MIKNIGIKTHSKKIKKAIKSKAENERIRKISNISRYKQKSFT